MVHMSVHLEYIVLAIKSQKFVAKYYKWLEFIISCTMIFLNRPKMQYAQA